MDHRVEMNHLNPKSSYLGPEGLSKEENELQNLMTTTADEILLPTHFYLFHFKSVIHLKVRSSLSEGHNYSIIGLKVSRSYTLDIHLKVQVILFNVEDVHSLTYISSNITVATHGTFSSNY